MKGKVHVLLASVVIVAGFGVASSTIAGGLLGGLKDTVSNVTETVTNTVTDTVDTVTDTVSDVTGTAGIGGTGTDVGGVVALNEDGSDAVLGLGVGSDGLSAAIGGSNPLVKASLSSGGVLVLDLLGLGLDVDLDLGIVNPDTGGPSNPENPNNPNNPNGPILVGSLGGGATFQITCAVNNTRQLLQVAANGKITAAEIKAWQRFANVQIMPIKLCPAAKKQVAQILARSQKVKLLQRAVMQDQLIMASLSRTKYDAGDVVAVQRQKGQLVVYVY